MTREHARGLVALGAGILFGAGLVLSGMTRPDRVLAFLDLFGAWDPTLAFVMIGAIGVHAVTRRLIVRRNPAVAQGESLLPARPIDARLAVGAAVFGIGWGLGGYCPGPSVVSLASGGGGVWLFVVAMVAGMWLASRLVQSSEAPAPSQASTSTAIGSALGGDGTRLPSARRSPS